MSTEINATDKKDTALRNAIVAMENNDDQDALAYAFRCDRSVKECESVLDHNSKEPVDESLKLAIAAMKDEEDLPVIQYGIRCVRAIAACKEVLKNREQAIAAAPKAYEIVAPDGRKFLSYEPTTLAGHTSRPLIYADALEPEVTGRPAVKPKL